MRGSKSRWHQIESRSEVHRAEVVDGAASGLKERGDELAGGREGTEVRLGEELEEDLVAKDVNEGGEGEVVIGSEVGVGDGENGKGGEVWEIHDEGRGKDEDGVE